MKRLDRVDVRTKLPIRRDAHWHRIAEGRYVGFRRMTRGRPGVWLARRYNSGAGKYEYPEGGIGDFSTLPDGEQFDAAKRAAEVWFQHLDMGGSAKSGTVKSACEAFVEYQRQEKSDSAADDVAGRFKRLVFDDPIARVDLAKLTPTHLTEWKARVLALAKKNSGKNPRGSYNRNATALRAALNMARKDGKIASDFAWREKLKPFTKDENGKDVARSRKLYLNAEARRKLIENASDEARALFKAMNLQPVRPGDIPAAKVDDLDTDNRALLLRGKTKEREIPLGRDAFEHFKACAKGKLPSAWLVARADGSQWKKEAWRDEIKLAASAAKLPRATVAYTFRHSVITDLINSGLHVASVAALAGTSIAMIEKNYFKLLQEHARKALDKLAALA